MHQHSINHLKYRNIAAGAFATLFEWYDYAVYGYFAIIIGKNFFPSTESSLETMSAFAVFATGFIMRPLGAIFFGFIGDRFGRRAALALSVIMMAIPTCLLGILPTYECIGIWAPLSLVLIRLIQGLAVGGNYGGSFVFSIEHAPPHQRGFAGSLVMVGVILGILLGSAMATFFSYILSAPALEQWGWRVPFIIGIIAIVAGFYIQKHTTETPLFQNSQNKRKEKTAFPLAILFQNHKTQLAQAIGLILFDVVGIYIFFFFMTTFLTTYTPITLPSALKMNTTNLLLMAICIPFFGRLTDKVGCKKILVYVALLFAFCSYPSFLIFSQGDLKTCWLMQMGMAFLMAALYGVLPLALVELFPVEIRYSATSFVCNVSAAVFGGTAPWFATWLIHTTHLVTAPAFYLMFISLIGLIAVKSLNFLKPLKSRTIQEKTPVNPKNRET